MGGTKIIDTSPNIQNIKENCDESSENDSGNCEYELIIHSSETDKMFMQIMSWKVCILSIVKIVIMIIIIVSHIYSIMRKVIVKISLTVNFKVNVKN